MVLNEMEKRQLFQVEGDSQTKISCHILRGRLEK